MLGSVTLVIHEAHIAQTGFRRPQRCVAPTVLGRGLTPEFLQIHLPQVTPVLSSVGAAQPCVENTLLSLFMEVVSSQN